MAVEPSEERSGGLGPHGPDCNCSHESGNEDDHSDDDDDEDDEDDEREAHARRELMALVSEPMMGFEDSFAVHSSDSSDSAVRANKRVKLDDAGADDSNHSIEAAEVASAQSSSGAVGEASSIDRTEAMSAAVSSDSSVVSESQGVDGIRAPAAVLQSASASEQESPVDIDPEALQQLESMGFTSNAANRALIRFRNHVNRALNYLIEHSSQSQLNEPISDAERAELASASSGDVQSVARELLRQMQAAGMSFSDAWAEMINQLGDVDVEDMEADYLF